MTDRRNAIAAELETGLSETVALFRSLNPADLLIQVYSDGNRWTVRQVLAHFIAIEGSMQKLFRNMLSGGPGAPPDFDFERFNRTQTPKLDGLALEELIARFIAVRRETVRIVKEMNEEELDREGLHAFHGRGRLERFIRWAHEHVRLHEADVRRALGRISN
jgi:uncharacterized protein (TIGR03083 family)